MEVPRLPLRTWVELAIAWLHEHLASLFRGISIVLDGLNDSFEYALTAAPPYLTVLIVVGITFWMRRRRGQAITVAVCLLLLWNQGLWEESMQTISLVLTSGILALGVGIPLGIAMSESRIVEIVSTPILDYMQTTPAFVYLIPAVAFFGIGDVPGIIATAAFALPPPARAVNLAIRQINPETVEAGKAFGSSTWQLLIKIKIPLAAPYIRFGVNQCIMMSLAMVIIASLIGARGLGTLVVEALTQFKLDQGIEAGVAVVLVAIILDRMSGTTTGSERA